MQLKKVSYAMYETAILGLFEKFRESTVIFVNPPKISVLPLGKTGLHTLHSTYFHGGKLHDYEVYHSFPSRSESPASGPNVMYFGS